MEEQVQVKPLKGFAIAGIIVGILALILSLFAFAGAALSWLSASAIWPAIISLILGVLGLIFASRAKAKKTLSIIVIIIALIAGGLGYWGIQKTKSALDDFATELDGDWEDAMDDAMEEMEDMEIE